MPINKSSLIRYKVINRKLSDGKMASKTELAQSCADTLDKSVSLRTIENDIHAMRYDKGLAYFAPIEYDPGERAYFYNESEYSIDNLPLGSKEIQNLRLAANLLKQYSDIHTFAEFSGTIDKVVRLVNYKKLQHDGAPIDFIEFEKNPTTTGFDFIDQLIPLIQNKKVVKLRHQSFWSEEVTTFTVHPFYLKEYKGRWYLVGCTEERKGIRIFGLERIVSIEALALKRFTPRPFNPELYFEKFIGINVPDSPPEKIVLRFKNNVGKYIQTQPIHSSQQLIHTNTGIHEFSFYLCINWEFIGFVLGWQGNVEVMEPESFRKKIKKILEASLEQYS